MVLYRVPHGQSLVDLHGVSNDGPAEWTFCQPLCTLTTGDVVPTRTEGDTDKAIHADLACEIVINLLHKWFNDIQ